MVEPELLASEVDDGEGVGVVLGRTLVVVQPGEQLLAVLAGTLSRGFQVGVSASSLYGYRSPPASAARKADGGRSAAPRRRAASPPSRRQPTPGSEEAARRAGEATPGGQATAIKAPAAAGAPPLRPLPGAEAGDGGTTSAVRFPPA
jgi:hypothetical protein